MREKEDWSAEGIAEHNRRAQQDWRIHSNCHYVQVDINSVLREFVKQGWFMPSFAGLQAFTNAVTLLATHGNAPKIEVLDHQSLGFKTISATWRLNQVWHLTLVGRDIEVMRDYGEASLISNLEELFDAVIEETIFNDAE